MLTMSAVVDFLLLRISVFWGSGESCIFCVPLLLVFQFLNFLHPRFLYPYYIPNHLHPSSPPLCDFKIHTISEISSSNITLWPLPIPLTCSSSASLEILSFHQNFRCTVFVKIYHRPPPFFHLLLGIILSNLLPFHLKTIWLTAHLSALPLVSLFVSIFSCGQW